jgi:hypothetical protein
VRYGKIAGGTPGRLMFLDMRTALVISGGAATSSRLLKNVS